MGKIQSCFERYEKKYLLTPEQHRAVLLEMAPYMMPDEHPRYSISNIYYDTENYELIRTSLEKPVYSEEDNNNHAMEVMRYESVVEAKAARPAAAGGHL